MPAIIDYRISQVGTDATSITAELPVGYVEGDLLLAFASKDDSAGGNYTCATSGWESLQHATVGTGFYSGRCGLFGKRATSTSETAPVIASTDTDSWVVCTLLIRGWHDTGTLADVISAVTKNEPNNVYPITANSVTTLHDDCLVLYLCGMGSASKTALIPLPQSGALWVTSAASVNCAIAIAAKYQHSAGASGTCLFYTEVNYYIYAPSITIALRGNGTHVQAHLDTAAITAISPLNATVYTIDSTVTGATVPTPVMSRTVQSVGGTTSDSGAYPYDDAYRLPVSSMTNFGAFGSAITTAKNISTGFVLGTYRFDTPKDAVSLGRNNNTEHGVLLLLANDTSNYDAWGIGGLGQEDMSVDGRSTYIVQTNQATDTRMTSAGTFNKTTFDLFFMLVRALTTTVNVSFSQFIHVAAAGLTVVGGTATNPITSKELERDIGKGYPLRLIENGVARVPLVFGGTNDIHIDLSFYSMNFPRLASTTTCLAHVDPGAFGITVKATATSTVKLPTGTFSATEKWHFIIHADSSASATYNFNGRTLVNCDVTLRPVTTFSGMGFVQSDITQNGSVITGCTFSDSRITADDPGDISSSTFTSGGTGHAITITAPGIYTISGLTFTGYGADGSTDAAIYNNSGGAVTLNVSGGSTPTVRNGTSASTTVVSGATLAFTGLKAGSEVRVYLGTDPATATEIDGTESSGTSFSMSHSVGGQDGYVVIMSLGYEPYSFDITFSSSDQSIPIQQQLDRVYAT